MTSWTAMSRFTPWGRSPAGQAELIEALSAHAGLILAAASRVLGSLVEAEDVAQDIAERLLRSPPTDERSWPGLLKTMAVNQSIDRLRRRRDWSALTPPDDPEEPDQAALDQQRAAALREAVAGLSDRDAALFSLHYFADLSHAEIAEQMDMKANAVGVAMHRLRNKLADDLRQRLGADDTGESQ